VGIRMRAWSFLTARGSSDPSVTAGG
jgi:hypothetical protein